MEWEVWRVGEDGSAQQPSLKEMVRSAVLRLSANPNGFFLMFEGGAHA